jgi:thiamine transport system ATP-binding protein
MLQLDNLQFGYSATSFSFNFQANIGEILAVVGPSGAGKSTLLNLIAGFTTSQRGQLYLAGHDHTHSAPSQRPTSMLFQTHNLFPHLTIAQNIGLGLHPGLRLSPLQWQMVSAMAAKLQLLEILQRLPEQLSGGQQQRAALARCLLRRQPILLLDEPFSALDPGLRRELLLLLKEIQSEQPLTILLVSHHLSEVASIAPRTLVIVAGKIAYDGTTSALLTGETINGSWGL